MNKNHMAFNSQSTLFNQHPPMTEGTVSDHVAQEKGWSEETSMRDINKGITEDHMTFSSPVTDAHLSHFNVSIHQG